MSKGERHTPNAQRGTPNARLASGDGRSEPAAKEHTDSQWPLWEVFVQPPKGAAHEHAGSVHAVDAEQALQNARDTYARRGEAVSIWVVPSTAISASTPDDMGPFFDPGNDKPYRHPQFYKVPRGVKGF
jgi:ring-1,2-phenylacetyl-CoA epoxidase subunit PaaB